jgi:hypothetical protein
MQWSIWPGDMCMVGYRDGTRAENLKMAKETHKLVMASSNILTETHGMMAIEIQL